MILNNLPKEGCFEYNLNMSFYTYIHFRESDGLPYYAGKGKDRRAWSHKGRSEYWKRTTNKHGKRVEIAAKWPTEADAFEHEKFLIACFRDLGYPLVNLTDGGEGPSGHVHTEEHKARIGASASITLADPDVKARQKQGIKNAWADPAKRQRIVSAQRENAATDERKTSRKTAADKVWSDAERIEKQRQRVTAFWADPEKRAAMLAARKAKHISTEGKS